MSDPGWKTELRAHVLDELFGKTDDRRNTELKRIIARNSEMYGNGQVLMQHKGQFFLSCSIKEAAPFPTAVNPVHSQMRTQLQDWIDEAINLDREKAYIGGYIGKVLLFTDQVKDMVELFPPQMKTCFLSGAMLPEMAPQADWRRVPENELIEFKANNAEYISHVNARFAMQLIDMR